MPYTALHSLAAPRTPVPNGAGRPLRSRLPRLRAPAAAFDAPAVRRRLPLLEAEGRRWAEAAGRALAVPCSLRRVTVGRHAAAGAVFSIRPGPDVDPVALRLPPDAVAALVTAASGVDTPALSTAPDRLTAAVLGHALLTVLEAVATEGPLDPVLSDAAPGAPTLWLEVRLELGGRGVTVQLGLREETARRLAAALAARPAPDASGPALLVPARLGLGPVRLGAATVAALSPGDAICPDARVALADGRISGPAWIATGRGPALTGRIEDGVFHFDAIASLHPTAEEPSMTSADQLPVDVHVELATVPVPLGDLAGLEPGAVLSLDRFEPRVRLRVGDRTLAEGDLVDVEGVLAVRILSRS